MKIPDFDDSVAAQFQGSVFETLNVALFVITPKLSRHLIWLDHA